ncbi:MAG TPA: chloramphenicol acetyltransferase [Stellaceae bacterium]|nr:chloramphenicol acetyltransferase [Stellaceae bacterium]
MIPVDFGEVDHPWHERAGMTEGPMIHPTALVKASRMGPWTVLGPRSRLLESDFRDYAYAVQDCDIFNADIGKFCNIAAAVRINPTNHPMERASQHHFTYRSRSHHLGAEDDATVFAWRRAHRVAIGPDVWIGHGAILMPGVSVATGAVIGAGAVVTHDVPAYTIAVGVPAKPLRRRFSEAVEAGLMRIAWWDWPKERLAAALADFRTLSAEDFVRKYDRAG